MFQDQAVYFLLRIQWSMISLLKCGRKSTFQTSQESRKHWTVSVQLHLLICSRLFSEKNPKKLPRPPHFLLLRQVPLIAVDDLIITAPCCFPAMLLWPAPLLTCLLADVSFMFPLPLASFELPQLGSTAGPSPAGVTKNTVQLPWWQL